MWFIAVHIFTQNCIPLAPYGELYFLKYMTVFCILRPLKKMLNEGKEQSLIPLLLLLVMRKSLSNVLFLYSVVF